MNTKSLSSKEQLQEWKDRNPGQHDTDILPDFETDKSEVSLQDLVSMPYLEFAALPWEDRKRCPIRNREPEPALITPTHDEWEARSSAERTAWPFAKGEEGKRLPRHEMPKDYFGVPDRSNLRTFLEPPENTPSPKHMVPLFRTPDGELWLEESLRAVPREQLIFRKGHIYCNDPMELATGEITAYSVSDIEAKPSDGTEDDPYVIRNNQWVRKSTPQQAVFIQVPPIAKGPTTHTAYKSAVTGEMIGVARPQTAEPEACSCHKCRIQKSMQDFTL